MRPAVRSRGAPRRLALAVLVVSVVGTVGATRTGPLPGPAWVAVLLAAGAAAPVVVDLGAGFSVLTSGALSVAYLAAGYADGPIYFAIPAVVFAVAASAPRPTWPWALVGATLGVAGLVARAALHPVARGVTWQAIGLAALVTAAYAVAAAVRARGIAAGARARSAASEERLRMAADLHDGVGHGLALIAVQAGAALHVLDRDPTSVRANLVAIREASRESLDLLRGQVARLAGDDATPRTPEPGFAEVRAMVDRVRASGLGVRLDLDADPAAPDPVQRAAYAVVQESLTNVLRHASATTAAVRIRDEAGRCVVTVDDDGRGGLPGVAAASGRGIAGMRARVTALGGALEAGPDGTGFRVRATLPVGEDR